MRTNNSNPGVTDPPITSFRGDYAFLSNFYPAQIVYRDLSYANNEAAFQAQKTFSVNERVRFSLPHLTDPKKAKAMGRKLYLRPDWEEIKLVCMYEICMTKFLQHPELRTALLSTGSRLLKEDNTWSDWYWGTVSGKGENHLGKILMDIREKLKNEM